MLKVSNSQDAEHMFGASFDSRVTLSHFWSGSPEREFLELTEWCGKRLVADSRKFLSFIYIGACAFRIAIIFVRGCYGSLFTRLAEGVRNFVFVSVGMSKGGPVWHAKAKFLTPSPRHFAQLLAGCGCKNLVARRGPQTVQPSFSAFMQAEVIRPRGLRTAAVPTRLRLARIFN
jgi:hypothetical protein